MTDTHPLAEVKAHLSSYVDRVQREHDRVIITRNGRPAAMLVSPDDIEALETTIELLSDPTALAELAEAEQDHREGRTIGIDELREEFGL